MSMCSNEKACEANQSALRCEDSANVELAEATARCIAAMEVELLTAIARMRTAIHMLDAGNTKGQVRLWLDGYCNTAPTEK